MKQPIFEEATPGVTSVAFLKRDGRLVPLVRADDFAGAPSGRFDLPDDPELYGRLGAAVAVVDAVIAGSSDGAARETIGRALSIAPQVEARCGDALSVPPIPRLPLGLPVSVGIEVRPIDSTSDLARAVRRAEEKKTSGGRGRPPALKVITAASDEDGATGP